MKKFLILCLSILFTTPLLANGIGANATSAPCDNATLETYGGTANVEINWEPNTINLRWYDRGERLSVQNAAQTCNYDGALTVPSQPTRTGYTFIGWEVLSAIPDEYTELEYIRSDGHAYINTGIVPTQRTRIEIVAKQDTGSGNINIFGSGYGTSGSTDNAAFVLNNGYTTNEYEVKFYTGGWHLVSYDTTLKNTLSLSMTEFKINGNVFLTNNLPLPNSGLQPFYLFQRYRPSISSTNNLVQIYSFEILDNEVSVLKFVPARRNSDNVVGMYDTVTQTFFTNAGTGTFIAGPVVQ